MPKTQKGKLCIGTSGWIYSDWEGIFYPEDLSSKNKLKYFSQYFKTTEINYSFYHLPRPSTYQNWYSETPADFIFALKASRFITHIKRLKGVKMAWQQFIENALFLKEKLGPILFQFPPSFKASEENIKRLENFLKLICEKKPGDRPRPPTKFWWGARQNFPGLAETSSHLAPFARLRRARVSDPGKLIKTTGGNPLLNLQGVTPCKFAFEFRHKTWCVQRIYDSLKKYNVAWVIADSPGYPKAEVITANFVYIRMHGSKVLFASKYNSKELKNLAQKIKKYLKQGLDVYCYFNNDAYGYAVENAKELLKLCKI